MKTYITRKPPARHEMRNNADEEPSLSGACRLVGKTDSKQITTQELFNNNSWGKDQDTERA